MKLMTPLIWEYSAEKTDDGEEHFPAMHAAQVEMVEWVDRRLSEWRVPKDAVWIVTADHGEMFGEYHKWGHGHGCFVEETTVPLICSDWDELRRMS